MVTSLREQGKSRKLTMNTRPSGNAWLRIIFFIITIMAVALMQGPDEARAATYWSMPNTTKNWNDSNTWYNSNSFSYGTPTTSDTVYFGYGAAGTSYDTHYTVAGECYAGSLRLGKFDGTSVSQNTDRLTFSSGSQLTVDGTLTMGNNNACYLLWCAEEIIDMSSGGTLSVRALAVNKSGETLTWTPGSSGGTVIMTATNTLPNSVFTTFYNFTISAGTTTLSTNLTVNGTLTVKSGATLNLSSYSLSAAAVVLETGATISGNGTLTLNGGVTVTSASASSAALISSKVALGSSTRSFSVADDSTTDTDLTISGVISGSGGITKVGAGTMVLSGNNTYTGATTVSTGILKLGAAGSGSNTPLGTTGSGTTVSTGAVLDLAGYTLATAEALTLNGTGISSGGALMNSSSSSVSYSGAITLGSAASIVADSGAITISGASATAGYALTLGGATGGTVSGVISGSGSIVKEGAGTWTLSGTNTYTGATTISVGTLKVGGTSALGTVAGGTTVSATGATLDLSGITLATAEPLTLNGTGISSGGALMNSSSSSVSYSGAITLGSAASIVADSGAITISGASATAGYALTLGGATGGTVSGAISGSGSLVKEGSGTWTLSGTNTYTGATTISVGTLKVGGTSALGTVAGGTTVSATGATLDLSGITLATAEPLTLNGTGISSAGALTNSSSTAVNYTGAITLASTSSIGATGNITLGGNGVSGGYDLSKVGAATLHLGTGAATLGALTISAGTLTATSGTMNLSGNFTNNSTFGAGGGTVTFNGSTTQTIGGSVSTTFNNVTTGGTTNTTTGIATIIGGALVIGDGSTFTAAGYDLTVTGTTTVGGGTSGSLVISSATGTKLFTGLVSVASGAAWNDSGNAAVEFRGGITNSGGAFSAGSGVYSFTTNDQALNGDEFTIPSVTVTGVTLTNSGTLSVATALSGTGGLAQGENATLNLCGTYGIATLTATATGNTVNFCGSGSQTIPAMDFYHLSSSDSGGRTLASSGAIGIAGTFTPGTNSYTITDSTVSFNGSSAQEIPAFTFNNLIINNSAGVTLAASVTVNVVLTFTSGKLTTDSNILILPVDASVSGVSTSCYINGYVQRAFTSSVTSYTFPIGDASLYAPLELIFSSISSGGSVIASVTGSDSANIASSDINSNRSVNHCWTLSNASTVFSSCDVTFNYGNGGDVDSGTTASAFICQLYSSGSWSTLTLSGTPTSTRTTVTGVTVLGDYAVGNYEPPSLTVLKSSDTGTPAPGDIVTYSQLVTNSGAGRAFDVIVSGAVGSYTQWGLDSYGSSTPFQFIDGSTASGVSLGTPVYSNDNGSSWTYTPVSGGNGAPEGYDGNVTNWKMPMNGTMNASGANFTVKYKVRVK